MKETKVLKTDIEYVVKQQRQHDYKKIGSIIKKIDGSRIYVVDKDTANIAEAVYEQSPIYNPLVGGAKKLHIEKNKIYVESLNKQNVIKRIKSGKVLFHT